MEHRGAGDVRAEEAVRHDDGAWLVDLRARLLRMRESPAPRMRAAANLFLAGFGASYEAARTKDAAIAAQSDALFQQALAAWVAALAQHIELRPVDRSAPEEADLRAAVVELAKAARAAMRTS